MKYIKTSSTILESKQLRYKSINDMFDWLETLPNNWVFIDTETTGLGGARNQQLTQISGIVVDKNFKELSIFDEKIELTDEIKTRMSNDVEFPKGLKVDGKLQKNPWGTDKILKFNHYTDGDYEYKDEKETVEQFFKWLEDYTPYTLVAQNASFDMAMLSGRYGNNITSKVLDTKIIIQLYYLPLLQVLAETNEEYKTKVDNIGFSSRDNGLISSSMSKIGPSLDIDMSNYHDALTDCRITVEMMQGIFNLLKEHSDVDISKYQIERIKTSRNG